MGEGGGGLLTEGILRFKNVWPDIFGSDFASENLLGAYKNTAW